MPPQPAPMPTNFKTGMVMFEGKGGKLFGILLVSWLLCAITAGIYTPWAYCKIKKFNLQNTIIDGKRFDFIGTGGQLLVQFLIMYLIAAITIGIYLPWGFCKIQRWIAENTVITN
jgi:uncharacterized membrane protein YjgN (DUF898 family)